SAPATSSTIVFIHFCGSLFIRALRSALSISLRFFWEFLVRLSSEYNCGRAKPPDDRFVGLDSRHFVRARSDSDRRCGGLEGAGGEDRVQGLFREAGV